MTDEELNKWNLRFCPKRSGHIQIYFRNKKECGLEIIKHCQNFITSDFGSKLTRKNFSDNERHKIIETFFGYNKTVFIDINELNSLSTEKLLFNNIEDFLKWFIYESSRYKDINSCTVKEFERLYYIIVDKFV